MKANELEIGDLVYNHRNWECPIVEIHKNSAVVIARHYGEEEFLLSDLRPIPLTPEILEKNGFRKRNWESNSYVNSESEAAYICFSIGDYTNLWGGGDQDYVWVTVKYVHQLQHALRLCGIEKEIIL